MQELILLTKENLTDYKNKILTFTKELKSESFLDCKNKCKPTAQSCAVCSVPSQRKEIVEKIETTIKDFNLTDKIYVFNMKRLKEDYVLLNTRQYDKFLKFINRNILEAIGIEEATIHEDTAYAISIKDFKFDLTEVDEIRIETKHQTQVIIKENPPEDIFKNSIFKKYSSSYTKFYKNKESALRFVEKLNQYLDDDVIEIKYCKDCGKPFILDARDILYFNKKNQVPHIRCSDCRSQRQILMNLQPCCECGKSFRLSSIYKRLPSNKKDVIVKCYNCINLDEVDTLKNSGLLRDDFSKTKE